MNKNELQVGTTAEQRTTAESGTSASLEQNGMLGDVPVVPFGKYELKNKSRVSYFKTFPDREIFECTLLGINFKDETMLLRIWYYGWSSPDWIDEYVHYSNVRHIA